MENETSEVIWQDRKHHLWFPISFTKYVVQNNRLLIQEGFLNSRLDETLLYRIVDLTMNQSLLGKLFGTGNITITTRVDTTGILVLQNIRHPVKIYTLLSEVVEQCRKSQNVVGKEFYGNRGSECHDHHDGSDAVDFDEHGYEMDSEI